MAGPPETGATSPSMTRTAVGNTQDGLWLLLTFPWPDSGVRDQLQAKLQESAGPSSADGLTQLQPEMTKSGLLGPCC